MSGIYSEIHLFTRRMVFESHININKHQSRMLELLELLEIIFGVGNELNEATWR
jgi:hypothetical protein